MKRMFSCVAALCAVAILVAFPVSAFAQAAATTTTTTVVSTPLGDWLASIQPVLTDIDTALVGVAVAVLLRFLPAGLKAIVSSFLTPQVEQLLANAIGYGINTVVGAEKGKSLDINVGNAVAAQALQYVIDHGPSWLISWAGGATLIEQKIIARLDLVAGTSVAAPVPAAVAAVVAASPQPITQVIPAAAPAA